ncbi:hypothetical protein [Nostoc sp. MS1]|uniref:hypothetical protein n=1 Tax=Nostoc sp. MS1 TaxID=2764711 RepID=UPI001CC3B680|nr:hypothetical protein [Nostoc sp. MS1]BCL37162.1 hypothetical protein NSMS1_36090 [Nostoc sp. MS1]
MLSNTKNNLFTVVNSEESAIVSGGATALTFNLDDYIFLVGAGQLYGNPGLTANELDAAWEQALGIK